MLQFVGVISMRLTREQKLELVKKHLESGISFRELAEEYRLETDKIKYFVSLYQMHGEQICTNQEKLSIYTREAQLEAIQRYLNGNESYRKIGIELGLSDANILRDWVTLYREKGEEAIKTTHVRRNYMLKENRLDRIASDEVKDRLAYLEAENDYLKNCTP